MGARVVILVIAALFGFSGIGVGVLFFLQNSARTTQLSLDLWLAAWQLGEPVSVTALIGVSFAAGFVVCGVLAAWRSLVTRRQIRKLQQQLALGGESASFQ
ncbi:MAG: ABC-type Fe3+ transport system permease subunit [Myxococcota bacterium]|jgi:ABC-type Fe3+ transport system permease subunit